MWPYRLVRSYLVLQLQKHRCVGRLPGGSGMNECSLVVARLSGKSLDELTSSMISKAQFVCRCRREECHGDIEFLEFLCRYRSGADQKGSAEAGAASLLGGDAIEWIRLEMYGGVFPLGNNHWFSGVLDAAGKCGSRGEEWLSCINAPHEHEHWSREQERRRGMLGARSIEL